ncbi:hypothetical protein BJY16_008608 [Actinoplanes octamycinicus]|uniref:Uncharacterized protein n=1 Tax=Actinoplanes octamycinicus TaxID=135948 RepID=A0A7W7H738_9ACTN|nr:hypothetical protein [Actinoplanes octamycinicus]MBB4745149.1 hypothetical protein [Actinoplanes octamycinicus]GIE62723.1 hypothetical protein Aoc01nite_81250 [Actinoplanes octamycinicus]
MSRDGGGPRHAAEGAAFEYRVTDGVLRIVGPSEFVLQVSLDRVRDLLPRLREAVEPGSAWLDVVGVRLSGVSWEALLSDVERMAAAGAAGPEPAGRTRAEAPPEPVSRVRAEPLPEPVGRMRAEALPEPVSRVRSEPPPEPVIHGAWAGRPGEHAEQPEPEPPAASRVKVSEPDPVEETEPAPPAKPVEPPPAVPPVEPPPPVKGPDLSPVVHHDDWLLLWPLSDTVALSRGELLRPPGGP